jgi:uncharacterized protein (DUF58 family)
LPKSPSQSDGAVQDRPLRGRWQQRVRSTVQTVRRWLRPPRRLHFTRAGTLLTGAIVALGFATLNTGNNLLYLILGGLLGLIMLSGWLSEQVLRGIMVRRRLPYAAVARDPVRIGYEVTNLKRRFPSLALELLEHGFPDPAFLSGVWPCKVAVARGEFTIARRGVVRFGTLIVRTGFPFGLFVKERDLSMPGTLVVWPRSDRAVREPLRAGERIRRIGSTATMGVAIGRGEYRSLRGYLPGDDPRDVHWRSTARRGMPVVREYERDSTDTLWICLDLRAPDGDAAEVAVEIAASLAAQAAAENERFGLATNDAVVDPGTGPGQMEAVLDTLARVRFRSAAPALTPPTDPGQCVLVTVGPQGDPHYADHFSAVDV